MLYMSNPILLRPYLVLDDMCDDDWSVIFGGMLDGPILKERWILGKVRMILEPCSLYFMLKEQALNVDTSIKIYLQRKRESVRKNYKCNAKILV